MMPWSLSRLVRYSSMFACLPAPNTCRACSLPLAACHPVGLLSTNHLVCVCVCHRTKWLARLSMPWVKLIDPIAGEKVGMLVEVELTDGSTAAGLFVHKYLSQSVGCVACC